MATTTALTVKDFLAQKLPEDRRYELVRGEVVEMGFAGHKHEEVKANIIRILVAYLLQNPLGKVYSETMYRLTEINACMPDASLLLTQDIPVPAGEGLLELSPALAVEVVSSESAADLERKVELYLEKGSRSVWVVYPEQRAVRVFERSGLSRLVRNDHTVEADWLPGFAVPASRFFEGL